MSTESLLVLALILTNAVWMTFHILTHAQHMRAQQWMVGFRPHNAPAQPQFIPNFHIPTPAVTNSPFADGVVARDTNLGNGKFSPMAEMGKITK